MALFGVLLVNLDGLEKKSSEKVRQGKLPKSEKTKVGRPPKFEKMGKPPKIEKKKVGKEKSPLCGKKSELKKSLKKVEKKIKKIKESRMSKKIEEPVHPNES